RASEAIDRSYEGRIILKKDTALEQLDFV
ncbi:uncharacterized protein METZ01_LOCUS98839, partial [marine metagenome]